MSIGSAWSRTLGLALLVSSACEGKPSAAKPAETPPATVESKTTAEVKAEPTTAAPRGRVLDGPLPIASVIGHSPAEVEQLVGEPLGKGMARDSCVRFVPKRVWFRCKFALQRYGDTTGKFSAIGVEYEDGIATAVTYEGLAASGAFDPNQALAFVGLQLPGQSVLETPAEGTKVWSWFNSAAELLIGGRQYRVRVSAIADDWQRSKVEVILNAPLDADEQARVLPAQP